MTGSAPEPSSSRLRPVHQLRIGIRPLDPHRAVVPRMEDVSARVRPAHVDRQQRLRRRGDLLPAHPVVARQCVDGHRGVLLVLRLLRVGPVPEPCPDRAVRGDLQVSDADQLQVGAGRPVDVHVAGVELHPGVPVVARRPRNVRAGRPQLAGLGGPHQPPAVPARGLCFRPCLERLPTVVIEHQDPRAEPTRAEQSAIAAGEELTPRMFVAAALPDLYEPIAPGDPDPAVWRDDELVDVAHAPAGRVGHDPCDAGR